MLVCGSTPVQRGQSQVMMKDSMSLISWYNKGHFRFLTNAYSPTKQGEQHGCRPIPIRDTHFFLVFIHVFSPQTLTDFFRFIQQLVFFFV
jgi:hypothetical protein